MATATSDKPHKSYIRGSSDLHLSSEGREQMRGLAAQFKRLGSVWRVYTSSQARAVETAHLLTVGQENTTMMAPSDALQSWFLGGYEGQEKDRVLRYIQDLVENRPWAVPPGMGEASTKPGECFLCFRERVIAEFRRLLETWEKHPDKRIIVVTHFHCLRMILAWLAKYKNEPPADGLGYDHKVYNVDEGAPGDVYLLRKSGDRISFDKIELEKEKVLRPGIYVVRHGKTTWN